MTIKRYIETLIIITIIIQAIWVQYISIQIGTRAQLQTTFPFYHFQQIPSRDLHKSGSPVPVGLFSIL